MRCRSPRTVGFQADGKTIAWSHKTSSKEFPTWPMPCGKCIECRLEYARQWAIRCVHESQMHANNSFITLTYSDANLPPKLVYEHFQDFMKSLRHKYCEQPIGMFVTGEYGETTKRPHWHAILFNFQFPDLEYWGKSETGDRLYTSAICDRLWGRNDPEKYPNKIGGVSFESAGYVARYASKKLVHGHDQAHDFNPISKKSSKYAIGKTWLQKYWQDVVNHGDVSIMKTDGSVQRCSTPRYYEKWLQKHQPEGWKTYVTETKLRRINQAAEKSASREEDTREQNLNRLPFEEPRVTAQQAQRIINDQKFNRLTKAKL